MKPPTEPIDDASAPVLPPSAAAVAASAAECGARCCEIGALCAVECEYRRASTSLFDAAVCGGGGGGEFASLIDGDADQADDVLSDENVDEWSDSSALLGDDDRVDDLRGENTEPGPSSSSSSIGGDGANSAFTACVAVDLRFMRLELVRCNVNGDAEVAANGVAFGVVADDALEAALTAATRFVEACVRFGHRLVDLLSDKFLSGRADSCAGCGVAIVAGSVYAGSEKCVCRGSPSTVESFACVLRRNSAFSLLSCNGGAILPPVHWLQRRKVRERSITTQMLNSGFEKCGLL
jgi:hypothetical protein